MTSTRGRSMLTAGALVALLAVPAQAAPPELIGTPEAVYDLSSDGSVGTGSRSGWDTGAFRWSLAGGYEVLGEVPGSTRTEGWGISDDGTVVVGHALIGHSYFGYRWVEGQGFSLLPVAPGGGTPNQTYDVSADGTLVGTTAGMPVDLSWFDPDLGVVYAHAMAARWTETGGLEALGSLAVPGTSSLFGLSADGSAAVGMSDGEAFLWTAAGGIQGLGTVQPGDTASTAWAVSADGSTVVGSNSEGGTPSHPRYQAFRWTAAQGMVGLGDFPGGEFQSVAFDVSADGSLVVGRGTPGWYLGSPDYYAFIWDAQNGMRLVSDMLEQDFGLDLTGWKLIDARAISANGAVIAGRGAGPNGERGWIARLPAPAVCSDAVDNDHDGLTDLDDPNCQGDPEGASEVRRGGGCGLGAELAPLLGGLAVLRRRRRSAARR